MDTFAPSYASLIFGGPGSVASNCKKVKYSSFMESPFFVPIGIDTGAFGKDANTFFLDLGNCLKLETEDLHSSFFFLQRLAVAVQQGNTAAVLCTSP